MRPLKIIHVCHSLLPGGISNFVKSIVALNDDSHSQHDLLVIKADPDAKTITKCIVHELNYGKNGFAVSVKKASHIFNQYDGIMIHAAHPAIIVPLIRTRKKVYFFQHGMTVSHGDIISRDLRKIWYSLLPLLLRAPVICSTKFAQEKLRRKGIFIPASFIRIVPFGISFPAGIPASSHEAPEKIIRLGLAGRLVAQKRFHLVLKSFIDYQGPIKYKISIAGDGSEKARLAEIAAQLTSSNVEVEFLGSVSDMTGFYSGLDLFVLPSEAESFGLVVLEALAHGIPVVVFQDVGGVLSLVEHERNGFVLEDETDLQNLWEKLATDPKILLALHKNTLEMNFDEFEVSNVRAKLDKLVSDEPPHTNSN